MTDTTPVSEISVTTETARELGLTDAEFDLICDKLGRTPTYTELGVYSVMWSEHCSYKNSILQLKTLPRSGGRMLVAAGEENAGVIDVGEGYGVAFKIESHNHPSAVEPFQGAATGVGGILRDIFTMGARPIAALNSLRFGEPDTERTKYLVKGVVHGIGHYGNCFGVPTVGGEIYFDRCYTDNPLVNAMAVGVLRADRMASATALGEGNPVFIMGSSTGRDGIHGASLLASREFDAQTENMRPTVQVGDPFSEKLLLEASLELIEAGVVVGMQDMGAAGISCSTAEMSAKGEVGMRIDLDKVPLREAGMSAYEIMLSESQERMLVVVQKGMEARAAEVCEKWDVPFVQIGEVTSDGHVNVSRHGKVVANIPAQSLVLGGDAPVYVREQKKPEYLELTNRPVDQGPNLHEKECTEILAKLLASPTIASKRWVYEQYDSQVGDNTVIRTGGDAAVLRIKELPGKAVAVTTDCNSRFVYLNPYRGAMSAVAEAARNCVCVGAEPVAITNCLNFGNPYDPEVYYQFAEAIRGMGDMCRALNTPVTGGNVSFHNESQQHAVFPTPTIGMLGLIDDITTVIGNAFVNENEHVLMLGWQRSELGGSEYLKTIKGRVTGEAPYIDIDEEVRLQRATLLAIRSGLITAAHDCSEGGLLVALSEMTFGKGLGATIDVPFDHNAGNVFGEAQSRIIVSVPSSALDTVRSLCSENNVPLTMLGTTGGTSLNINGLINQPVTDLRAIFEGALPSIMAS
ncbi:MAG: phosphoribosylformylglycinamidine synthase subunit PurL [Candidatus Kapabacteria bacterium]|nr:phosphoribosylformylglycinamidine synthase subunit PurL [Candidatus Kapabacteria bacterium]MBP7093888.1 phosphoribosylformylglycinamidine synthase subunit PurL [Candidatus Kapabacteria bacterium]